jgi:prepilin-type N-terminal cleavage/methylation domain-containing protein
MKDEGYTLVEMLVAIAIIGLAFGGLSESAKVVSMLQAGAGKASADASARDTAQRDLNRFLADTGPFLSTGAGSFIGKAGGFSFDCGNGATCQAQIQSGAGKTWLVTSVAGQPGISVRVPAGAQFRYVDVSGQQAIWPTAEVEPTQLHSISLIDADAYGFPIATTRLSVDERPGCVFDVVAQGCRAAP